jgi:hypothetical protein
MNKFFSITAIGLLALSFSFQSCKKDDDITPAPTTPSTPTGSIRMTFENHFGDSTLDLGTESYITANNDTLVCTTFKYYISNIRFTDMDGNTWSEPESYHLVDASSASSLSFVISGIPQKHYTSVSYTIGVDSARNVSGSQTGALDPGNGMFWTWNTGYIFAKLEGTCPQSNSPAHAVTFHIGGYAGQYAAQRNVSITFGSTHAMVTESGVPVVTLKADAAEWFCTPNLIDLSTTSNAVMPNATSASIADNYANMFSLLSVQN